ncbi:MAG: diaminopimelate decarboxylase, partial [Chloroflexi bacterium]|nr:diaminopimelate decarboxylase [Chloroflexota bacterium]
MDAHIHYSAKANANLAILRTLVAAGAGVDAVSGGEIYRALLAGARPEDIVFAGVGKTPAELRYALEQQVGWFNVENLDELRLLNQLAAETGRPARVALRLNPDIAASTHPHIATGHSGAKFGLPTDMVRDTLARQAEYPHLRFDGIHIHIGSQLHDTQATRRAVEVALELVAPYPAIRTVNIGGGLPVAYTPDETLPSPEDFAAALRPLLAAYTVLLEPGRSIIADAGILLVTALYRKQQAGQTFLITDGSMAELIRPALYDAYHEIVPVSQPPEGAARCPVDVVGPVCETADVLGRSRLLPDIRPGDLLAVLTAGAYGWVMASNYNQRPRPPEVVVSDDGQTWQVARRRETWDDLARLEESGYYPPA